MNPKVKARWVAALRSGEYEQTQGRLESLDGRFCCLGVLCRIEGRPRSVDHSIYEGEGDFPITYDGYGSSPSDDFLEEIGLHGAFTNELIDLNDGKHASFAEIADWIEENL